MKNELLLLYSGGTDSTLAACLTAPSYSRVHLVTFSRYGLFSVHNSDMNAAKIRDRYGTERVVRAVIPVDRLFKKISYDRYLSNIFRWGFFLLSTCGFCKLAMHARALIYCLDNGITAVADGANKGMYLFPDQMPEVIAELKKMYAAFGVEYINPVFDFEGPQDIDFTDRFHLESLPGFERVKDAAFYEHKKKTAGYKLFELGMMPSDNVKGTQLDHRMQPRCFQFILFNIWLHWYYLPFSDYGTYKKESVAFFSDKIARLTGLLDGYVKDREKSELYRHIQH